MRIVYIVRIVQTERIEEFLPRRLKAARALAGLGVAEVAARLDWSPDKLYRFERGDQVPNAVELAAFATATGQTVAYFLNEEKQSNGVPDDRHP